MFLNKYAHFFLLLAIVFFLWSCSEDKSTSPNDSTELSSSSKKDDEVSSSSNKESEVSSSSADEPKESSSSKKDDEVSSSSNKESEVSSSSADEPKESSSSKKDDFEYSSSSYYKSSWIYLNESIQYDTTIDSRDNQVYKILTIGEQTWMAENLNYYDTIQIPELKQHSRCFADKESNCELYGRLYDLSVTLDYNPDEKDLFDLYYEDKSKDTSDIQGICPNGWRIPTQSEFKKLIDAFSYKQLVSKGTSGFSVIQFSGYWDSYTKKYINTESDFWTTSYSSGTNADIIHFIQGYALTNYGYYYEDAVSVRCLKKD